MLTTRTALPFSSSFTFASTTSCSSEPAPSKMMSAGLPAVSAITYPPRRAPLAGADLVRSRGGTFWRESASRIGPCVCVIATRQASTASFASPGRITVRWGIARREATCSTGSWGGASSPTPVQSCVKTKTNRSSINPALRSNHRRQPNRRARVVGEAEKARAVWDEAAVQRDAVEDRAHAVLADSKMRIAALVLAALKVATVLDIGEGRLVQVGGAAEQPPEIGRAHV